MMYGTMLPASQWLWLPDDEARAYGPVDNMVDVFDYPDADLPPTKIVPVQIPTGFIRLLEQYTGVTANDSVCLKVERRHKGYLLCFMVNNHKWIELIYWPKSKAPNWVCN